MTMTMNKISCRIPDFFAGMNEEQIRKREEEIAKYEIEQEKRQRLDNLYHCGIGENQKKMSFNNFQAKNQQQKEMLNLAKNYVDAIREGKKLNLVISGDKGTGKTHIVTAILRELNSSKHLTKYGDEYFHVCYLTSETLLSRLKASENYKNTESSESIFRDYSEFYDLVVIDEVGRCYTTPEKESDALFQLVDRLYKNDKSIIFVTNYDKNEMKNKLKSAVLSRLTAENKMIYFETSGIPDMRNIKK